MAIKQSDSETEMRAEIERRGFKVSQRGTCWRVHGQGGVDVLVSSLRELTPNDFNFSPAPSRKFTPNKLKEKT